MINAANNSAIPAATIPQNAGAQPIVAGDPILDDLQMFARDLGIAGTGAMSKGELIETLRQRYILQTLLLAGAAPARTARS